MLFSASAEAQTNCPSKATELGCHRVSVIFTPKRTKTPKTVRFLYIVITSEGARPHCCWAVEGGTKFALYLTVDEFTPRGRI